MEAVDNSQNVLNFLAFHNILIRKYVCTMDNNEVCSYYSVVDKTTDKIRIEHDFENNDGMKEA